MLGWADRLAAHAHIARLTRFCPGHPLPLACHAVWLSVRCACPYSRSVERTRIHASPTALICRLISMFMPHRNAPAIPYVPAIICL